MARPFSRSRAAVSLFPPAENRRFVPASEIGGVIRGPGWQFTVSWITWGREFKTQPQRAEFTSAALTLFR